MYQQISQKGHKLLKFDFINLQCDAMPFACAFSESEWNQTLIFCAHLLSYSNQSPIAQTKR